MTDPDARPSPETWAQARRDYLSGVSAPVVAERHGLSERTLRRRAAAEGWRRLDLEAAERGPAPSWNRGPLSRQEAVARMPELGEIEDARGSDNFFLLFDPDPAELRRFAFRRAAELAATDAPQQALIWMRLVQTLDRSGDRIERESKPFQDMDYLRAAYLRRLGEDVADGRLDPASQDFADD